MRKSRLSVVTYPISSAKIGSDFWGFRIAVISDLHNCSVGEDNTLLVDTMADLAPDCILLAGDMITEEKRRGKVCEDKAMDLLGKLAAIAPVYYGMGNHEQRWKDRDLPQRRAFDGFCDDLRRMGITLLDNRSVRLRKGDAEIRVTGLALPNTFYNKKKIVHLRAEQIDKLVGGTDDSCYQLLLAHTPQFFAAYETWGADMTLVGHYHGGVIRLPWLGGVISTNFRLFPKYDHGRYQRGGREMIVTSGLGCHTIPVRLNNPPELVIMEFVGE